MSTETKGDKEPAPESKGDAKRAYLPKERYTVAIACALPIELAAVCVVLDDEHPMRPQEERDSNQYAFGRIGEHNVVVACLPKSVYGQTSAAIVVSSLSSSYPGVNSVILVGIAGGCRDPDAQERDVRRGDVVVSIEKGVVHLDAAALAHGELKERSHLPTPSKRLLGAVAAAEAAALLTDPPGLRPDSRFAKRSAFAAPSQAAYELKGRDPAVNCVLHGGIASVDSAVTDAKLRDALRSKGDFLCVDTASAGVAAVDTLQYLVVRGICDFCDGNNGASKGDNKEGYLAWNGFAAAQAASFVARLLTKLAVVAGDAGSVMKAETSDFSSLMSHKLRHKFVGREWMFERIQKWLGETDAKAANPYLLITGDPGVGRSALMVELIGKEKDGKNGRLETKMGCILLGYHLCSYDARRTLSAAGFVRSISSMCEQRLAGYSDALSFNPRNLAEPACLADPVEAFVCMLTTLQRLALPAKPCCLVVDSLDESLTCTGFGETLTIAELLATPRVTESMPLWLRVIATSRRVSNVEQLFGEAKVTVLNAHSEEGRADVGRWIADQMDLPEMAPVLRMAETQFAEPDRQLSKNYKTLSHEWMLGRLTTYADGNFLVATQLVKMLTTGDRAFQIDALPAQISSLSTLYFWSFSRQFGASGTGPWQRMRVVFSVMAATRNYQNMSAGLLEGAFLTAFPALQHEDFVDAMRMASPFIDLASDGFVFHHKSVCDWLLSAENKAYRVDEQRGLRLSVCACLLIIQSIGCRAEQCKLGALLATLGGCSAPLRRVHPASHKYGVDAVADLWTFADDACVKSGLGDLELRPVYRQLRTCCLNHYHPASKSFLGDRFFLGSFALIRSLVQDWHASPDEIGPWEDWPALFDCIFRQNVERARVLIQCGADADWQYSPDRVTALHWAAREPDGLALARLLVEQGKANVSAVDHLGRTPLDYALTLLGSKHEIVAFLRPLTEHRLRAEKRWQAADRVAAGLATRASFDYGDSDTDSGADDADEAKSEVDLHQTGLYILDDESTSSSSDGDNSDLDMPVASHGTKRKTPCADDASSDVLPQQGAAKRARTQQGDNDNGGSVGFHSDYPSSAAGTGGSSGFGLGSGSGSSFSADAGSARNDRSGSSGGACARSGSGSESADAAATID